MNQEEFTEDQKLYLQGFVSGAELGRAAKGLATFAATLGLAAETNGLTTVAATGPAEPPPSGPDAVATLARNRVLAEGKTLCPQEKYKHGRNPLDIWDDLARHAAEGRFPKGDDVFGFKYHGLFYVAPAQDSFMCRLRLPGGLATSHQFRGIARIADDHGGGYADATTRANLQIREIRPNHALDVLTSLQDLGIVARGAGADNVRNVTGSPTAGIDPHELIDTRPHTRSMHYHILHSRDMYGLPRKFNIAFDGGGRVSALEDANDLGFSAVRVGEGKSVPAGVYFRVRLGGISGHQDFARDEGVLLTPDQCIPVAAAVVRVFNEHGDRTDRKKARLKYLLDAWGHERYVAEVEKHLPFPLVRLPSTECEPRPPVDKHGHLGVHPQKQAGLYYIGVSLPVGRLRTDQMRGLADLADRFGSGTIRMTVWQNLLISDVKGEDVPDAKRMIEELGLHWRASNVRGGLVACTGSAGCKFAAADTKRHAMAVADHLDSRMELDQPINIHLTGCPNSCAQHYLGDVGLLGTTVEVGDDMVEGYHVFIGGGYGDDRRIGREVLRNVAAEDVPSVVEWMLRAYLEHRESADESFNDFVRRHPTDVLKAWFEQSPLGSI